MSEISGPTDIHPEPFCSFCGAPKGQRRVLIASEIAPAFICDICAPQAARQASDIIARQNEESQNG